MSTFSLRARPVFRRPSRAANYAWVLIVAGLSVHSGAYAGQAAVKQEYKFAVKCASYFTISGGMLERKHSPDSALSRKYDTARAHYRDAALSLATSFGKNSDTVEADIGGDENLGVSSDAYWLQSRKVCRADAVKKKLLGPKD